MKAPKDCPPLPLASTVRVSSGRTPQRRVISEPRIVPKARSAPETRTSRRWAFPSFSDFRKAGSSSFRSAVFSRPKL